MKDQKISRGEERHLLDFAGSYLAEAFPNPDRQGCPPEAALRLLAVRPKEADPSLTEHLTCCSPCFKRYTELLGELKTELSAAKRGFWKNVATWILLSRRTVVRAVALGAALALGAYLLVIKLERPKNATTGTSTAATGVPRTEPQTGPIFSEFILDLSKLSPARGSKPLATGSQRRVHVPSSPLDLTLALPLGSEEQSYRVTLRSGGQVFWSKSTQAHMHKGRILLRMEADFTQVPAGNYNLEVESSTGIRLSQPVLMEAALPKSTDKNDER